MGNRSEGKLKQRLQFLLELYKISGNTTLVVSMWDIGKNLGFDRGYDDQSY
jgi:hypothetical protein